MKYVIVGKNMEVSPSLEKSVKDKLGKLEKFFAEDTTAHVTLEVNHGRHIMEVTIPTKGGVIRCEQSSNDMYTTVDQAEEVIEKQLKKYKSKIVKKQLKKYKSKIVKKHKAQAAFKREYLEEPYASDEEIRIVRNKQFEMKPMYPEDACVQMELLGHGFYVFRNAESEEINVVYKRKDGAYGLIEPEN